MNTLVTAHASRKIFTLNLVWWSCLVCGRQARYRKLDLLLTSAVNFLHRTQKAEALFQPCGFVYSRLYCFYRHVLSRWYLCRVTSWACSWRSSSFLCITPHQGSVPLQPAAAVEMGFENVPWHICESLLQIICRARISSVFKIAVLDRYASFADSLSVAKQKKRPDSKVIPPPLAENSCYCCHGPDLLNTSIPCKLQMDISFGSFGPHTTLSAQAWAEMVICTVAEKKRQKYGQLTHCWTLKAAVCSQNKDPKILHR